MGKLEANIFSVLPITIWSVLAFESASCRFTFLVALVLIYQYPLQIYVKQQRDLQFLNFNVENSQELIQIYDSKMEESKALESR